MNSAIEFHDSDVQSVTLDRQTLLVQFSPAYIHRSSGTPGIDAGEGHAQDAQLIFGNVDISTIPLGCSGRLSDGRVEIDEQTFSLIPLPSSFDGAVRAEFTFSNGVSLTFRARSVAFRSVGESRLIDHFPG
jgi:hypothetical protein